MINIACLVIFAGALIVVLHWPAEYQTTMLDKMLLAIISISCGIGIALSLFGAAQYIGNLVANPGVGL